MLNALDYYMGVVRYRGDVPDTVPAYVREDRDKKKEGQSSSPGIKKNSQPQPRLDLCFFKLPELLDCSSFSVSPIISYTL